MGQNQGLGQGPGKALGLGRTEALVTGDVEAQAQAEAEALGQGDGLSLTKGLGLRLRLADGLVVDEDLSALTGDAAPATSLPTRKHVAATARTLSAIPPNALCGNNVAESEDEFVPEFAGRFVTDFVVRSVAGDASA